MTSNYISKKGIGFLFFYLLLNLLQAQTNFTGTTGGNWNDLANWNNGLPAVGNDGLIPGGIVVKVTTPLTINFGLQCYGGIDNSSTINIDKTVSIAGSFTNSGTLNVNATFTFSLEFGSVCTNSGIINNNENFINTGTLDNAGTINNAKVFNNNFQINNTLNFVNKVGSTLNNIGTFDNKKNLTNEASATIANNFKINNTGTITNSGSINNNDQINNNIGGKINNLNGATISLNFGSVITNNDSFINDIGSKIISNGSLNNNKTFTNSGTIESNGGGFIRNKSSFTNTGSIKNINSITNDSLFIINGILENNSGGVLTNNKELVITTTGNVLNSYEIYNKPNALVTNNGILSNGVRVFNEGIFTNNGFLQNIGEFFNKIGGTLNNRELIDNKEGGIVNEGTINNFKNFFNGKCSVLNNKSIINNTGLITNKGIIFQRGTISGNPILSPNGFIHTGATSNANICRPDTVNTNITGELKVYAQSFIAKNLTYLDSCNVFIYSDNGLGRTVFGCADVGKTIPVNFKIQTRTGDSLTCQTTVTFVDRLAPEFSNCPIDQQIYTNQSTVIANWLAPGVVDNCTSAANLVNTVSKSPGSSFTLGTTEVTYNSTDASGNLNNCKFKITVNQVTGTPNCTGDTQAPTITNCPNDIVKNILSGGAYIDWNDPTFTDNCLPITVTINDRKGRVFTKDTSKIIYTVKDANGNTSNCMFNVIINKPNLCTNDVLPPQLANCPSNIFVLANPITNTGFAVWEDPKFNDNCSFIVPTSNYTSGTSFPVGNTTVIYTGKDAKNNSSTCTFTVNIAVNDPCPNDVTAPVFSNCPANITVNTNTSAANVNWTAPTATDNCSSVTINVSNSPGVYTLGTTKITYYASDLKGNTSACSFNITVYNACATDTVRPVFAGCPASFSINSNTTPATWIPPTASDNCGSVNIYTTALPGSLFPIGSSTVVYTVIDGSGNSNNCAFVITVNNTNPCTNDIVAPVFSNCPANISLVTTGNTAVATWTAPTATDNCSTPTVTSTHTSGTTFIIGTTTVSYTATDAKGNKATCSFTITVTKNDPCATDITPPVFANCPTSITVSTANTSATATWTAPTATDNCSIPTITSTHVSGATFNIGTTTVSYTATDALGNKATCSFTVTVNKTVDICANLDANINVVGNSIEITGITSSAAEVQIFNSSWGSVFSKTIFTTSVTIPNLPIGSYYIILKILGPGGTWPSLCERNKQVNVTGTTNPCTNDIVNPVIANCPSNITLSTTTTGAVATWTAPTATDNCSTPTLTSTHVSGATFLVGSTIVTYTATDAKGNTATCSLVVRVDNVNGCNTDIIAPVFSNCPANITLNTTSTSAIANWVAPTATDNCGIPTITSTHNSGGTFPVGVTTVTYTATDAKGNKSTCVFNITVTQTVTTGNICQNPAANIIAVGNTIEITGITTFAAYIQVFSASWATIFNNTTTTSSVTIPNLANGNYIVKVSVLNAGGLWPALCDVTGNVSITNTTNPCANDVTKPIFTLCPTNINVTTSNTTAIATWTLPTATDNCGVPTLISTHNSGASFPLGNTTVTYTATDAKGNTAVCSFVVNVSNTNPCTTDIIPPVIANCPANISLTTASTSAVATWAIPTATDNCGTPTLSGNYTSGTAFPIGITTVTYTATDAKGNISKCTFTVNVTQSTNTGCNFTATAASGKIDITGMTTTGNIQLFTCGWSPISVTNFTSAAFSIPLQAGCYILKYWSLECGEKRFDITVTGTADPCINITSIKSIQNATYSCNNNTSAYVLYINTNAQIWQAGSDLRFIEYNNNTATLKGTIINGTTTGTLNVNFTGKSLTPPDAASPKYELCTTTGGQNWYYYTGFTGIINLNGTVYNVSRKSSAFQIGNGASLINPGYGASGWWTSSFGDGDFNFLIGNTLTCNPTNASIGNANSLFSFDAFQEFKNIRLDWLSNSKNIVKYEVQKINSQGNWEIIDIRDHKGTNNNLNTYLDLNPYNGENIYRIVYTNLDGTVFNSQVRIINFSKRNELILFPNPADEYINIDLENYINKSVSINIFNILGQKVQSLQIDKVSQNINKIDIQHLPESEYIMIIENSGMKTNSKIFHKAR